MAEITEVEEQLQEEAKKAFETLFRVVNKMVYGPKAVEAALLDHLAHEHRTLQQEWWGVIAKVIGEYAKSSTDLRNEDSVKWAKEVAKIDAYMRYI